MKDKQGGVSRRERLELTLTALLPAALGLLSPMTARAGRLSWLGPLLALPVGLFLCLVWGSLGERSLSQGLEEAFGPLLGKACRLLYLLWGLFLLTDAAQRYAARLLMVLEGEDLRWLFLLTALGLCLWLARGDGMVLARTGRIFFLAVGVTLALILFLALPSVNWQNLWPPDPGDLAGALGSGALCLSLSGYGVFALCLPRRREGKVRTRVWTVWGAVVLSALLFIVVGAFGPALTAQMEEPFLFLLEGVRVPGAFRRGEAALVAVLALGDMTLLALLTWSCRQLWGEILPRWKGGGRWPVALAFLLAGLLPRGLFPESWITAAGLILGILFPVFAFFTRKSKKAKGKATIFSVREKEN